MTDHRKNMEARLPSMTDAELQQHALYFHAARALIEERARARQERQRFYLWRKARPDFAGWNVLLIDPECKSQTDLLDVLLGTPAVNTFGPFRSLEGVVNMILVQMGKMTEQNRLWWESVENWDVDEPLPEFMRPATLTIAKSDPALGAVAAVLTSPRRESYADKWPEI